MHDEALFKKLKGRTVSDEAGCWMWTGAYHSSTRYPSGHHGQTSIGHGKTTSTHRAMWLAVHGPIPPQMQVLHRCDKPKCVNPEHLWLGTHAQNMRDMYEKGRHAQKAQTTCKRGHPLSGDNVRVRGNTRVCRKCALAAVLRYNARRGKGTTASPDTP